MKNYVVIFILLSSVKSLSQEFRGGEIWFERLNAIEYDIYVDLYMKDTGSFEKPFLMVSDGFSSPDTASLILSEQLPQSIKLLRYKTHFFLSLENTEYIIYVADTFYLPELKNLQGPNKNFYLLHSFVTTTWYQIFGNNSPPVFSNKQTDYTFKNGVFMFNSVAQDPNGDTLFYGLKNYNNFPGFVYDHPTASDSFSCGFTNGFITWDKPIEPGKYLFGVEVYEYRPNGFFLGRGGRDIIVEITEDELLSVGPHSKVMDMLLSAFPNPAHTSITFSVQNISTPATLTAHNLLGQPVLQRTLLPAGGDIYETVDVSTWPPGVYFFTLRVGGQVWSEKAVIRE